MKKFNLHLFRNNAKYIVAGFVVACLTLAFFWAMGLLFQDVRNNSVIAPYYEPNVFQKPKDIPTSAPVPNEVEKKVRLPIVMYHYVEYVKDLGDVIRKSLNITPYTFEAEIKVLHDTNYKNYWVKDMPDILSGNIVLSDKSVILTFDDGYADFYTDVLPILEKYQVKATIFVIYDYIGRRGFLSETQIKEIIRSGLVEVAAHTMDHAYLKNLPEKTALYQIQQSKTLMEQRFGVKIDSFAYPYGAFSQETIGLVQKSGFVAAVSVIPTVWQTKDNLFYLGRIRAGMLSPRTIISVLESYNK